MFRSFVIVLIHPFQYYFSEGCNTSEVSIWIKLCLAVGLGIGDTGG